MAFISLICASLIASASARNVVLETVTVLPEGWKQSDVAVDSDKSIDLSIALKHNVASLKSTFASASEHLSRDDVRSLRAPDQAHVDTVMKWLASENIDGKADHDVVKVSTTVGKAAKLLGTEFHQFNYDDDVAKIRALEYSVPEDVSEAVSFVHPVVNFMRPTRKSTVKQNAAAAALNAAASDTDDGRAVCSGRVTPSCLRELYNINYTTPDSKSDVRFAISGYLEQNGNHHDLQTFFRNFSSDLVGYDFKVETVNGGKDPQTPAGGEAMLDLEYGMAIGYPAQTTYYATGGRGTKLGDDGKPLQGEADDNEPYLDFIQYLLDMPDNEVPHVLSVSYGDDELTVPKKYAERVCNLYGMLTKRGTSVIHSSGDGGAAGGRVGNCRTKDGQYTKTTMPTFPAGCPWVTALGGTTSAQEPAVGAEFSSGGFSTYFSRESWQVDATDGYIEALDGHLDGYYNTTGRGIPDISLVANDYQVVVNGRLSSLRGTSASAPVFAAMIALVNDARFRAGKKSIGHLNPILYSDEVKAVIQDTTQGVSAGCDFADGGWPAKEGWDAITGVGVPNDFVKFMDVLVAA
jgi:tripeptidyl-peptidase-1